MQSLIDHGTDLEHILPTAMFYNTKMAMRKYL